MVSEKAATAHVQSARPCPLKRCDARMQDGGISVVDGGKAALDRRVKLNRISYLLAVAAEGGRNFGEAPVLDLAALTQAATGMNSSSAPCRLDRRAEPTP